ncbi:GntR family transcriptional regulator [Caballeronia ptereochthonis]|uniref:GntR family transcriptional regulator n=1 Tax=Caballeronia ptereochthonis TaxID=1777144 RepID=A0A158D9L6_9BURK|nr:GntR family transcriptional regulator [Caballeronia ptereochthonis]SAK91259.1 GntR family transcriptional regulator [Caballeronia ptereochthonis]
MTDFDDETDAPEGGETSDELLSMQIAQRLRTLIATDELKPGERLRERTLAERLDVSRTPLREALKELAGDGLVVVLPKRGAVVAELSAAEITEKLDVLGVIEAFGGEMACRMATDAEIAEIRALHFEMHAAYERRDRMNYFRLNQAIHTSIVAAAKNATLRQVHERLNRQLYRYRFQGSVTSETWHTAIDEHEVIVQLLSAREGAKLGEFLRRHVHSTWEQLAPEEEGVGVAKDSKTADA